MENTNNAVVISLSDRLKPLNPVDRVNEIAATVLYDPKYVESMTCYPAVRTYLTKVPGLNFILESEAKKKWKLSEILSEDEKEKCENCPVYEFRFDDETMTMIVHREGDKKKRPIGLIVNHAVVLDTNMQYTCNSFVEFEDKEFGVFEWFSKAYAEVVKVDEKSSERSFFENLKIKQVENFKGMKYGEKFDEFVDKVTQTDLKAKIVDLKKEVVNSDENKTILENFRDKQIENFKSMEYGKKIKTITGDYESDNKFQSFKETHISNFKTMEYQKKISAIRENFFGPEPETYLSFIDGTPRKTYKNRQFSKKMQKVLYDYDLIYDLAQAYPDDFSYSDFFTIKNKSIKLDVKVDGIQFKLVPYEAEIKYEEVHWSTLEGKEVYGIDGDFALVVACDILDEEWNIIAMFVEDEFENFMTKRRQIAAEKFKKSANCIGKNFKIYLNNLAVKKGMKVLEAANLLQEQRRINREERLAKEEAERIQREKILLEAKQLEEQKEMLRKQLPYELFKALQDFEKGERVISAYIGIVRDAQNNILFKDLGEYVWAFTKMPDSQFYYLNEKCEDYIYQKSQLAKRVQLDNEFSSKVHY